LIYPPYNISKNDQNIIIYIKDKEEKNNKESSLNKKKIIKNNRDYLKYNNNKSFLLPSLYNNNVVNFDKMLSRDYINKIKERKGNVYSNLCPNYESIKPKCIMKVAYWYKPHFKKINSEFKGTLNECSIDLDKYFNRYNNHMGPKDIYLDKMAGRESNDNSPLPSYMFNQYDRNSFNTFNDKSLEMNNYANGSLKELKSSFNDKKSFNYRLNEQINNGTDKYMTEELNTIMKKINYEIKESKSIDNNKFYKIKKIRNNSSIRLKIPEYYKVNMDRIGVYPYSHCEKIDGFTLKTIKSNKSAIDLLTNKEKKIFLSKLD
jgi:hypothetical protein